MDGYALRAEHQNLQPLRQVGTSFAGHPYVGAVEPGQCVRIFTGAALPDLTDAVVPQENTSVDGGLITLTEMVQAAEHVRAPGNDVIKGAPILARGTRISAFHIGWLSACGLSHVDVYDQPKVAVFSTGDELQLPGNPLSEGQIYDSNRIAVTQLLANLPVRVTDLGILKDDAAAVKQALLDAAEKFDLIITSGGVSVGDADFVTDVVRSHGELALWKINIKPGKPLAFGRIRNAWFLGLPGNPVSTIVTLLMIALPAILKHSGAIPDATPRFYARLTDLIIHRPGREEFQRGIMGNDPETGEVTVRATGDQGSNRLATFADANCLIRVPKNWGDVGTGRTVEVLPFYGLVT